MRRSLPLAVLLLLVAATSGGCAHPCVAGCGDALRQLCAGCLGHHHRPFPVAPCPVPAPQAAAIVQPAPVPCEPCAPQAIVAAPVPCPQPCVQPCVPRCPPPVCCQEYVVETCCDPCCGSVVWETCAPCCAGP